MTLNTKGQAIVKDLLSNPIKYGHMFGFKDLGQLHNEWIRLMMWEKDDYTLLGHRGSYKTTCLSIAFAFLIVLRPDITIFFLRKTDDDVVEIVRQTQKILQSDEMYDIVMGIYGVQLELTDKSVNKINTNLNTSGKGQPQLLGLGMNSSLTGKHADYVFTDDIVNLNDRLFKSKRDETKMRYQELQNVKNRGGRIFNTGTPWHRDDCISTLMPNVHKFSVYDTGMITAEQQQALRESMVPSLYAANYELRHIADVDALFPAPNMLPPGDESSRLIYEGMGHIDAGYHGEDFTAYTLMHQLKDGRIIAYGRMWAKHVDRCVPEVMALHNLYRAGSISCERNPDKGALVKELEELGFVVHGYDEKMNKYVKILTYLKRHWSRIYWLAETDPDYLGQILDYSEYSDHDDAPDSAASLVRRIMNRPVANMGEHLVGGW